MRVQRSKTLAIGAICLVALYYAVGLVWRQAHSGGGRLAWDLYALYYPNLLYSLDSLRLGEGLFWNRFQNCSQPFFSIAATGTLYPPHLVYLFLDTYAGLFALLALHLAIGGLGAFLLFRRMRLGVAADSPYKLGI